MRKVSAWLVVFVLTSFAAQAAAEPIAQPRSLPLALEPPAPSPVAQNSVRRDSLWNGTLIGAAAGIGSVVVLDALLCDVPDGNCDTPWAAYLTLGGIGAAAGAGIDFLIGRKTDGANRKLRLAPLVDRSVKGVRASIRF